MVSEEERLRELAWRKNARGKGLRWRILRDLVALASLKWMTTSEVQIKMRRLWGLRNKTTREMLEELEQGKSIQRERDESDKRYKWGSTPKGVAFWIKTPRAIPAGVVEVALTSMSVEESEV